MGCWVQTSHQHQVLGRPWNSLAEVPRVWRWRRGGWKPQTVKDLKRQIMPLVTSFSSVCIKGHSTVCGLAAWYQPLTRRGSDTLLSNLAWPGRPICSEQGLRSTGELILAFPARTCVPALRRSCGKTPLLLRVGAGFL